MPPQQNDPEYLPPQLPPAEQGREALYNPAPSIEATTNTPESPAATHNPDEAIAQANSDLLRAYKEQDAAASTAENPNDPINNLQLPPVERAEGYLNHNESTFVNAEIANITRSVTNTPRPAAVSHRWAGILDGIGERVSKITKRFKK